MTPKRKKETKTPENIAVEEINEAIRHGIKRLDLSHRNLITLPPDIARITNLVSLDLSNNKLENLPSDIFDLQHLEYLDISNNRFTELPCNFVRLRVLDIGENLIRLLPGNVGKLQRTTYLRLTNNHIAELPLEIGELTSLVTLLLEGNELSFLPKSFGHLEKLKCLYITNNRFSKFPIETTRTMALEVLSISGNQITELPPEIEKLSNLKVLIVGNTTEIEHTDHDFEDIQTPWNEIYGNILKERSQYIWTPRDKKLADINGRNKLKTFPKSIGNLESMKVLLASDNYITELPQEIKHLSNLISLDLHGNNLAIPPEVLKNINYPQSILNYYFSTLDEQRKSINEIKLLFVGQGSVGKTSLIWRLLLNDFDPTLSKTDGIEINLWEIYTDHSTKDSEKTEFLTRRSSKVQINIWDFGGQEIMHATHQFFLTKRSLYLLVLDSRLSQEENRVEYWLKIIQSFGGESPVLIVGNKTDQHPLDIDRTGLQKKYPNIVGIRETSAVTGAGIEELKAAIAEQVNNLPHVRDLLPETWFIVKTKLEGLGRESNFITYDKYLELCAENEVTDEISQRTLIGFLHDLGVVLHFQDDPRLEALGILNPQWVTNGVYKILNSHALFQNKGVLTMSMLDEILNLPEYPRGKRLFIVDMMKKFELCYDIEPDKTFLVPDLLPKDEPAELKFNGVPAFEYAYPVLPSSVITRFIVRMNQKIDDGLVWRTGVVLKIGENKALVKADIEDRKVTIAIDGVEHTRRDALSAIRYQLDEIHGSIKGLDAQKRVPIPEAPQAEPLDYDYLLQLERDGELDILPVKDGDRLVKINVRKLLSGVVSETERRQGAGNVTNIYVGGDVTGANIISGEGNQATVESDAKKKSARKKS